MVIKHLYLKGLTPKEIQTELDEVRGTSVPLFATVYNWANEFKRGRTSTKDKHRLGRPVEETSPGGLAKFTINKIGCEKNLSKRGAVFVFRKQ